jgi:hypothetical protein
MLTRQDWALRNPRQDTPHAAKVVYSSHSMKEASMSNIEQNRPTEEERIHEGYSEMGKRAVKPARNRWQRKNKRARSIG